MTGLYKYLAPFLADTFGFQEIVDVTDGMGILDDCSAYKGRASRTDINEPFSGSRLVTTNIRSEDIIGGTKEKIIKTFRDTNRLFSPAFVLVGTAPAASMVATDMNGAAAAITQESGIPAAAVDLNGHKFYDKGISHTLISLAKLLVKPSDEKISGGVNLIGGNAIDWTSENVRAVKRWAEDCGFTVVSQWGGRETAENLANAAKAEVNLVTAAAGLKTARWFESELGIPYVAAAPFGRSWSEMTAQAVREKRQPELKGSEGGSKLLIIGEQLMSNAIRATLMLDFGIEGVDVCTFFTFDKALAAPGDKRVKGEEGLINYLAAGNYDAVIADADLAALIPEHCCHIALPHGGTCCEYYGDGMPRLAGGELNRWLNANFGGTEV